MAQAFFKNPANEKNIEVIEGAFLWTILLGPLFFVIKGVWVHALVSLVLAIVTFGISWFIYPLASHNILRSHYLNRGWIEISELEAPDNLTAKKVGFFEMGWADKGIVISLAVTVILLFEAHWLLAILWLVISMFLLFRFGGEPKECLPEVRK